MKANELRIGNLVKHKDSNLVYVVNGIITEITNLGDMEHRYAYRIRSHNDDDKFRQYYNDKDDNYEPIPLTEEWLRKFGYDKNEDTPDTPVFYFKSWGRNGVEIIAVNYHYKGFEYELGKGRFKFLEYVHQLQNLYFALTGEELTIKEEQQ